MPDDDKTETGVRSEIMTLSEIARYLKVSDKTILRMVKRRELPGSKVSNQWRFQLAVVDQWLTAKMQDASDSDLVNVIRTMPSIIPITQLITSDRILMHLEPGDKGAILKQLIRPLVDSDLLDDPDQFLSDLQERENMGSTGIGDGVAIPHVREQEGSGVRQVCMVLGLCEEGVDFDSLDSEPCYVFMLLCANSAVLHLRLLAKTMFLLRNPGMAESLRTCACKKDVMGLLMDAHFDLSVRL